MKASLIRKLEDLDDTQAGLAGGKGASLGELVRAGVRVPAAFVITRLAFDAFMKEADPDGKVAHWVKELDSDRLEVEETAKRIDVLLRAASVPAEVMRGIHAAWIELGVDRVSVRSSATCEDGTASAWAGQLDTYLNVGATDLEKQVKGCWLSIFRAPALAYGAAHGYGAGEFAVAVVVQKMVPSEVSGIGFSVHPVTQEPDLRLIEACFGQGEAIVSGEIAPDQYVVERGAKRIVENARGEQKKGLFLEPDADKPVWKELGARGGEPKLNDVQILEYASLLDRIEAHYGHPVDTEWAVAGGDFYLLQARPITTLAAEYRESIVEPSVPWHAMVRRPLNLLEASLVGHWLDAAHMGHDFGFSINHFLAIEDAGGLFNFFVDGDEMGTALDQIREMETNDRSRLIGYLENAHEIYVEGLARMESGDGFTDLDEACEYFMQMGRNTTGFPVWTLSALDAGHLQDPKVIELAERLRARSLYTPIMHQWIAPLAEERARAMGFSEAARVGEVASSSELRSGTLDAAEFERRLELANSGHRVVFHTLPSGERVRLVSETGYLLMRLAGQRQVVPPDDPDRVSGQAAWPGVHRGRARVIMSSDPAGYTVDDGDVLVSIQSNPALMPLLRHAGAIVTDDGGVACHAGIICRELKIPTIIGTRRATSIIHDGDIVEVDATQQVVRVIERAGAAGT